MYESRCVSKLDGDSGWRKLLEVVAAALCREEHECGSDAFSSRRKEVGHRRRHHIGIVLDEAAQAGLNGFEVTGDRTEDAVGSGI
jgi:hypothetical protein